jgi:hypothetical protein
MGIPVTLVSTVCECMEWNPRRIQMFKVEQSNQFEELLHSYSVAQHNGLTLKRNWCWLVSVVEKADWVQSLGTCSEARFCHSQLQPWTVQSIEEITLLGTT